MSFIENGSSIYLNPGALDGIRKFAGTGVFTGFILNATTPVLGPRTAVESETGVAPMFLVGAGYRVHERVVVGLGVFPTSGLGAEYKLPGDQSLKLAFVKFEAAPAVSFRIIEGLSLGLTYRITHTRQELHSPAVPPGAPGGPASPTDVSLSGTNFFGFSVGTYYRPIEPLHIGLTFRSQVGGVITGTTETGGQSLDTRSELGSPARVNLGVSYKIANKVLVAADAKYSFFSSSTKVLNTTVTTPAGKVTQATPLNWKDVPAFGLGAEYWPIEELAVRGGYSLSEMATPDASANPLTPPPGWMHGGHLGVGLKLSRVEVDLGGGYLYVGSDVSPPQGSPIAPGVYKMHAILASTSVTYAF